MNEVGAGIIGLTLVLALFFTGIELGFAMALVGFVGFSYVVSTKAALNLLAKDIFDVFSSYGFTVIPLFIFMGQIAFNAGIAKRLYDTAYKFIGHIPGGLAMATVGGQPLSRRSAVLPQPQPPPSPAWPFRRWIDMGIIKNYRPESWPPSGPWGSSCLPVSL